MRSTTVLVLTLVLMSHLQAAEPANEAASHPPTVLQDAWGPDFYDYDASGNIKSIGTDRYAYDAVGRLVYFSVGARHPGLSQSYTYDAWGNMTSLNTGSISTTFGVDPNTNRIAL